MEIKCGDANPNGNVALNFKGGCGKEVELKDAYRCTGCGAFFHLDCIFEHFEQEKGHDYARNALKKIKEFSLESTMHINDRRKIQEFVKEGLDRKPEARRVKI